MDYKEALQYLDSFVDYEKIGHKESKVFKLERMRRLAQIFDNPQDKFLSIHIAGTKGKGSIAAFISNILKESGFAVGLYTSPHLVDPRERIKINNESISKNELAFYVSIIRQKLEEENIGFSPTFFEVYTTLAFNYFKEKKIDFGVIEVGLGGRLDATNIIQPLVSVISPLSYDHTHILGNSLEKIAIEKSGIIKRGRVCISAPQENSALKVIKRVCKNQGAELILVGKDIGFKEIYHGAEKEIFDIQGILRRYKHCITHLLGRHQIINAACAIGIAECLKRRGIEISEDYIKIGLEKTENPGRCEKYAENPYIILDGAQNRASAKALRDTVKRNFNYRQLILILGISKEKDIKGICEELTTLANMIILTKAKIERAEEPRTIQKFISTSARVGKEREVILTNSVEEAMERALVLASPQDMILVAGSFFVISEVKVGGSSIVQEVKCEKN